jgi:thiamine-monophosphate kinase
MDSFRLYGTNVYAPCNLPQAPSPISAKYSRYIFEPVWLSGLKHQGYNRLSMSSQKTQRINQLGEFGLIDLLNKMIVEQRSAVNNAPAHGFRLLVDTGDDTAAWETVKGTELFTTDTVVEGIHFTRSTTPWADLGWKSLASNISDIAAMGGLPTYALITLGLPPETEVEDIKELYRGMLEISNAYGVSLVGGDMVRSPVVFITVALTGYHPAKPMLRTTGKAGDKIGVTGPLGGSGGGLRLMLHKEPTELAISQESTEYLKRCHRRPQPAVDEGRILANAGIATAMDVSDGLADDLSKLCRASGLSARLYSEQIPLHTLLKEAFPDQCLELALYGGEDYILLFMAESELMERVMPQLEQGSVVGELFSGEPGRVVIIDGSGKEIDAGRGGWDHFA